MILKNWLLAASFQYFIKSSESGKTIVRKDIWYSVICFSIIMVFYGFTSVFFFSACFRVSKYSLQSNLCFQYNQTSNNPLALATHHPVARTLSVMSKTMHLVVSARPTILAIPTVFADPNVYWIQTALETGAVSVINASILVPERAESILNVEFQITFLFAAA